MTPKVYVLQYSPMVEVIAFWPKLDENKIVLSLEMRIGFSFHLALFKSILWIQKPNEKCCIQLN